ncbi:MAG: MOSC domain-containing protein [Rhodopila sp.]
MSVVGHVESLWRYPVKSMRGEELQDAFIGFSGMYGDRLYAFHSTTARPVLPFLTGRDLAEMLLYQPGFRHPEKAARPVNVAEAHAIPPGANPLYAGPAELAVDVRTPDGDVLAIDSPVLHHRLSTALGGEDVRTPDGDVLAIDSPVLHHRLSTALGGEGTLTLRRSDRAMTDCRPISLISTQTIAALAEEIGMALDRRRFRANICIDLDAASGFAEDALLGRSLKIGARTVVVIVERDPRCKMITLDPDTAQASPAILRTVAQAHEGKAGVYAAVLTEGTIRPGDEIVLMS